MRGKHFPLYYVYSEELTIDYGWDKDEFDIPHHVMCLCEKPKCRKYLMRAKNKQFPENQLQHDAKKD
jgi:hypothetical protein